MLGSETRRGTMGTIVEHNHARNRRPTQIEKRIEKREEKKRKEKKDKNKKKARR